MTPTEQDKKLRAEVKQILKDGFDYYIGERKNTSSDMKPLDIYCTEHLMQLIKQHREAYALEIIGDDEKVPESIFEYGDDDQRKYWYNKLRAELRKKVGRDDTK